MSKNFRDPDLVRRYEYSYFDLQTPLNAVVPNAAHQTKDNYQFVVDNTTEVDPIDWYNAWFEVEFSMKTLADSAVGIDVGTDNVDKFVAPNNGLSFIKSISVEASSASIYTNNSANESTNILTHLNFSKPYADAIGPDQFFYIDEKNGHAEPRPAEAEYNSGFAMRKKLTAGNATTIKMSIPLNQYSFFAAFKNNLAPNMKTIINLTLEDDINMIYRIGATASKIIISKLRLWCPKINFNGKGLEIYRSDYLKPKKWSFLQEKLEKMQTTAQNGFFRITSGINRPRHVFIWTVPTGAYTAQTQTIFQTTTQRVGTGNRKFVKAQLEINNSTYYPRLDLTSTDASRIYRTLMSFNSAYGDVLTGPLITRDRFEKTMGILYFDLRNQEEDLKNGTTALTFRYELSGLPGSNYTLCALVLHEHTLELFQDSNRLLIRQITE